METTTIQVAEETADELHDRKRRGETYDDVIRRLLEEPVDERRREPVQEAAPGDVDEGKELIRCEHCGHEWATSSSAERPTCSNCTRKTDRVPV